MIAPGSRPGFKISVSSQNCNSLNVVSSIKNQDLKISAIVGYKTDVIFLSDVRLNGKEQVVTEKLRLWYKMEHNSSMNRRGVAILFSNQVEYEILDSARDLQENALLLKVKINDNELVLASVYGPNDNNCADFFGFLTATLNRWNNPPCIMGGDWNATLSNMPPATNPDVVFMRNIPSRIRSDYITDLCATLDLSDPFRTLNPDAREFTYNPSGTLRQNRSRIDFFLVSPCLYEHIVSCTIAQGYCRKAFDHKPIFLNMKKRFGKGRSCIQDGTINNPLAEDAVRFSVHSCIVQAALGSAGLASREILLSERDKLNVIFEKINRLLFLRGLVTAREGTREEQAEMVDLAASLVELWEDAASTDYLYSFERQVEPDAFFEELILNVKKIMVNFQIYVKTAESTAKKNWTRELLALKSQNYVLNFDRISVLEKKLNDASEKFVSDRLGNYIKTDVLNSEKMTPRFLRIAETQNNAALSSIKNQDGLVFVRNDEREEYITSFYEDLYKIPATAPIDLTGCIENFLGDIVNHPAVRGCILDEVEKTRLEADITLDELDEAVRLCNSKSAPGIDGINNRFIKKFWSYFRIPLYDYVSVCMRKGSLTGTFSTALIRLIPKKGDTSQLKNWRPISLLSCFYKIVSKTINARLDTIINKVTSLAQKAYNRDRYIQEALINTIDTIRHCEINQVRGAILSIDQKKAFDSVFHLYMREVYKFFNFGPNFTNILETIGTGRTARIILENGKNSRIFDLERGFAQGDSPSPRNYNIGEQIVLFRLEFDPLISGVYVNFLIPRTVNNNIINAPLVEKAEQLGLRVDPELVHNNRKTSAFADDTNGALARNADNLRRIKKVLEDFGNISGLMTNVDKTTLMPIGCLDDPLEDDIIDLGFEVVNNINCLGLNINNRADNLTDHFVGKIAKIRQLIGSWSRYNLSLPGRIAISKTMLISQIGYIGCIISPTPNQLSEAQNLIDSFVNNGLTIAADRLYTKPSEGGLGLINLGTYIAALQCSWVKRCAVSINDTWRWVLANSCNFCLDNLRYSKIDAAAHPILAYIALSFSKLQAKYWELNENFLSAPLVDNNFFLRAAAARRAPERGNVDRNLLGHIFYDDNLDQLHSLRMGCLIRGNRVVDFETLRRSSGLDFQFNTYLRLCTAARFALVKYGNKVGSNGTCVPLNWLLQRVKKGSKRFRLIIENRKENEGGIEKLRVVKTFFQLIDCPAPERNKIRTLYGTWNWSFFSNRIRVFIFQFLNNSLGVGARVGARYRNGGINIDQRCTFCVRAGALVPAREDFSHVFFLCPQISRTRERINDLLLPAGNANNLQISRLSGITGLVPNSSTEDEFFYVLSSLLLNYCIWQAKLKKTIPSVATLLTEIDHLFFGINSTSTRIRNLSTYSLTPICRRWRGAGGRDP